jgi:hypothetical protein
MKTIKLKEMRTLPDIIKHEGIKAKGFGTIAKFIMHDKDLTLESKAIYGYLCSLCGSGIETFPSRDTILRTLKLSKDGYYSHYTALQKHGYLKVSKLNPSDVKSQNIYTIVANPQKVDEYIKLNGIGNDKKLVGFGIDAYGYGILPKAVMLDERLDIKTKGIYCYFASYAGAGETAFPEKEHILYHLNISDKTYRKYYNQLIQYNYIIPVQRKENGRFGVCDYMLNQMPDETIGAAIQQSRRNRIQSPSGKKQDTAPNTKKEDIIEPRIKPENKEKTAASPSGKKQDGTKQDGRKPNGKKQDTTIINVSKNKSSINSIINQSEKAASPQIDSIDKNIEINLFSKNDIADKIALKELLNESPTKNELINFIYDILCETLSIQPKSPYVWINRRNTPFQEVFNAFSLINKNHIEYVLFSCYNNDNLIKAKNPKAYVKHSLLRSTLTLENFDSRKFKKLETRTPDQIRRDELIEAKIRRDQERMFERIREDERDNDFFQDYDY